MRSPFRRLLVLVAGLAVLGATAAACGDDSGSSSTTSSDTVTVTDAWARTSAASQSTGAAYMTITGGKSADTLTAVAVPADVAKTAEMHETAMAMGASGASGSGMMEMKPVSSIAIGAGKSVALAPGGYHIMLMELVKPLTTGQKFTLTLTFEKAGKVEVPVEVRAA